MNNYVFIVTGDVGEGKTTFVTELIEILKLNSIKIAGFIAPSIFENNIKKGFLITNIKTQCSKLLCMNEYINGFFNIGKFYFNPEGINMGVELIQPENIKEDNLVVIDEVGIFELDNLVWSESIDNLIKKTSKNLLLIVREGLLENVIEKWQIKNYTLINIRASNIDNIAYLIINQVNPPIFE